MKTRLFNTTGFRFAALSAVVFVLCALLLSALVYYGIRESMEQQLRDQIVAETRQLLGDYQDDGLEELRHDIDERLERNPGARPRYTLSNSEGVSVFDRLVLSESDGWSRSAVNGTADLILLTTSLDDGFRLGVAADTNPTS
ncbi:MAG: hypothetical protein ACREXS_10360 [Gammaproteobacteria bacterium]